MNALAARAENFELPDLSPILARRVTHSRLDKALSV